MGRVGKKWLLRDQPCVRLASGDVNTMMLLGPQCCFSLLEKEISTLSQRDEGERAWEGWLASTPLRPTAPFTGTAPPDESKNKEVNVHFLLRSCQGSIETNW